MSGGSPNRFGDRIVFWTCAIGALAFMFQSVYDYGVSKGEAKCAPVVAVPKKSQHSLYDLTPRQLRRMIRYEQAKGL